MTIGTGHGKHERLLQAMAEELKLPLLHVARQAELARNNPDPELLEGIETAATQAMGFVDSYLLSQQLKTQISLELEPVAVSAVLHDAASQLHDLARQYDCTLELQVSGKYGPVMAHRRALQSALVDIGATLITAEHSQPKPTIIFAAHRSRGGVMAGVFTQTEALSQAMFDRGKVLYGRVRQPLQTMTHLPGAGIYIADSLLHAMASELRVAKHHQMTGLAATLPPSQQMSLIV